MTAPRTGNHTSQHPVAGHSRRTNPQAFGKWVHRPRITAGKVCASSGSIRTHRVRIGSPPSLRRTTDPPGDASDRVRPGPLRRCFGLLCGSPATARIPGTARTVEQHGGMPAAGGYQRGPQWKGHIRQGGPRTHHVQGYRTTPEGGGTCTPVQVLQSTPCASGAARLRALRLLQGNGPTRMGTRPAPWISRARGARAERARRDNRG